MSKNNYINSKTLTVGVITAVTMVYTIVGFAMAGGSVMATAAYGAILGGIIGIVLGSTIDHYYETGLSSIIAGISAVIGGILGAIYGKTHIEDTDGQEVDSSFTKGASCLKESIISNISNLKDCLAGDVTSCIEATGGLPEIITCMGEDNNNVA